MPAGSAERPMKAPRKSESRPTLPTVMVGFPVIFFVQNNMYAISVPEAQQVAGSVAGKAAGYGMPGVTVDGNHPLAGVPLNFAVEVIEVREASQEEISHGHVHGPGGHQHA